MYTYLKKKKRKEVISIIAGVPPSFSTINLWRHKIGWYQWDQQMQQ